MFILCNSLPIYPSVFLSVCVYPQKLLQRLHNRLPTGRAQRMARLRVYVIYFPGHYAAVINMSPHYNLSLLWRCIADSALGQKTTESSVCYCRCRYVCCCVDGCCVMIIDCGIGTCIQEVVCSIASHHSVNKRYNLVLAKGQWCSEPGMVTSVLAEDTLFLQVSEHVAH